MTVQIDKILHFLAGFAIATVVVVVFINSNNHLIFGFIASIVGGILKEVYDIKIKKTHFDWYDVLATILGGIAAISVLSFL